MERRQLSEFGEAVENAKDINILESSEEDIFNVMKQAFLNAFERETTFDMRILEQMNLIKDKCAVGIVSEKDGKLYPYVKLAIAITDGYYDVDKKIFKMYKKRDAEFEVMLTPFNCKLEKLGQKTGVYGGSDRELTVAWRKILMSVFPKWEEKFKEYLENIKKVKIDRAQVDSKLKIQIINNQTKAVCDEAEEEYNTELASVGLE